MFWRVSCPYGCPWKAVTWLRRNAILRIDEHKGVCSKRPILPDPASYLSNRQ